MTTPVTLRNLVDGKWIVGGGAELRSVSPHDPAVTVGLGRHASQGDVDAAVQGAAVAKDLWRRTPMHQRGQCLLRAADVVDEHADDWARELAREEGKPIGEARGEVGRAAQVLRYHAQRADSPCGEIFASPRAGEKILVDRRPVGVVAVITPFNFPIAIPAWKIAPALVYGNTVVWKPPTSVPLLAVRLTEALVAGGLPTGVLSLVHGDGDVGQWLTEHPAVDAVTFTGSTEVGRRVAGACALRGVPVQAEMGGKNAAVVLADADLDRAVAEVTSGAFRSAGQKCTATSRVVVHSTVAGAFLEALTAATSALRVGDPELADTYVGPVVSLAARDRLRDAVASATSAGARLLAHAVVDTELEGHYVPPTVLSLATPTGRLWDDEIFGPVLAVTVVDDTEAAMRTATAGPYGLSVSVFTSDLTAAMTAIEELGVGMIHLNSETAGADPHVPFGGNGSSGYGPREQGVEARDFFTMTQTVYLRP